MLKIIQNTIKKISSFLTLLVIILIIFFNKNNKVYGADENWIEVSRTPVGIQYLLSNSVNNKDEGVIEITTKYLKINTNASKKIEENIYIMRINCFTNKFKDISINGKKNFTAKWQDPNEDKLINDIISESCSDGSTL